MKREYASTDFDGYVRDVNSRAIINTNEHELMAYRQKVAEYNRLQELEKNVDSLKSDITDIKDLLQKLAGKLND